MRLSQNSGVPIYQQIADSFKSDILAGKYAQGEYLPSIRGLARDLKISVITTMKAYELLEQEAEKLTQAARYERNEARQGYRAASSKGRGIFDGGHSCGTYCGVVGR